MKLMGFMMKCLKDMIDQKPVDMSININKFLLVKNEISM